MAAMVAAVNDGVNVISMSLGGIYMKSQYTYTDPVTGEVTKMSDTADYVAYTRAAKYANSKGILIVAAAGNSGINAGNKREVTDYANEQYAQFGYKFRGASFYTPASIPNVVTVSATGPKDELALYSNYGSGYVDVTAPGGDYRLWDQYESEGRFNEYIDNMIYAQEFCLSSVPYVEYTYDENGLITNYEYVEPSYSFYVGTSMATPKVAAAAALIIAKHGNLGPNRVKVLLQQSAEDIGPKGNDKFFGHGLVNAYNILSK
jgi:lantibiotic leader peptide-processing serine protease